MSHAKIRRRKEEILLCHTGDEGGRALAALSGGFRGGCLTGRTQWWLLGMSPWYEKPLADRFTTPYVPP